MPGRAGTPKGDPGARKWRQRAEGYKAVAGGVSATRHCYW